MDPWYLAHLVCPRDHLELGRNGSRLECARGHAYGVVNGIPVMLVADVEQTMGIAEASRKAALDPSRQHEIPEELYLDCLPISEEDRAGVGALARQRTHPIDPVVAYLIGATNGLMYRRLIGRLRTYPIPELPMPPGGGELLLDVGCSWGRWSIAAARNGYSAVGIDPSLGAIMAARRVAQALGTPVRYVVGDARFLPFRPATFDRVFSFSVLQHLSVANAAVAVGEIARVLKTGGLSVVQMPTRFGVRCLYHQARRGFREARGFEVRYWTLPELQRVFGGTIGNTETAVHCYFGIGLQRSDAPLMPPSFKVVLAASEWLRRASRWAPPLKWAADSVYVKSTK